MSLVFCRRQTGRNIQYSDYGVRVYREVYMVKSDDPNESKATILQDGPLTGPTPLPTYSARYDEDDTAECSRIDPQQTNEPTLWRVICEWTTMHGGTQPDDMQLPPDQRRIRYSMRFSKIHLYRSRDLEGWSFTDSADTPLNPPPDMPYVVDELICSYYRLASNYSRSDDRYWMRACNSDVWNGLDVGTCMVDDITADDYYEMGNWYFHQTIKILVSPWIANTNALDDAGNPAWYGGFYPTYVLDHGPRKKIDDPDNPGQKKSVPISDMMSGRIYLDGTAKLLDGQGGISCSGAKEVYLRFATAKPVPFNDLAIWPPFNL